MKTKTRLSILDFRHITNAPKVTCVPSDIFCQCHNTNLMMMYINGMKYDTYCPTCKRETEREMHN